MIRYAFDLYPRSDPKDGARIRRLSHLQAAEYRADGGTNSGSITLRANSPDGDDLDPEGLQYIRVVRINTAVVDGGTLSGFSELVVGGFFLENGDYKALSKQSEKLLTFTGAGTLSYLDRAIQAHQSYLTVPFIGHHPFDDRWRLWAAGTGNELGAILWRVITELQEAGRPQNPIPDLTLDFTYLLDSNGASWVASSGDFEAQVGERVLLVVKRLMEMGLWVEMDPDTFDLRAYEPGTHARDRTGGAWGANVVRFQAPIGQDITTGNIKSDASRGIAPLIVGSDVMVGANDIYEWVNATDVGVPIPSAFVWERSYRVEDTTGGSFEAIGTQQLQARADAGDVVRLRGKLGNSPTTGYYLPFEHVRVDDVATLHNGTGQWDWNEADQKVAAVAITLREGGDWDFLVDLGSQYASIESREFAIAPVGAHHHPSILCDPTQTVETSTAWKMATTGSPPAGWHDVGFNDSAFANPVVVGHAIWADNGSPRWLWEDTDSVQGSGEERSFRTEFSIAAIPSIVSLAVAADNGCEVFLNGTLIGSAVVPTSIAVFDVDPSELLVGLNCLSIIGENEVGAFPGPAGVYAVLSLNGAGGGSNQAARCDHNHVHNDLTGRTVDDTHPASAISFTPHGSIAATDVQAAIQEVRDEAGGGSSAPDDATYLVGAAHADLTSEIVVGATPGGELGGSWASPTVDATHAGSDHLQPVRKNSGGSDVTRRRLNLIEGSNVTLTVADDAGNDEVDVTIAASVSGSGATNRVRKTAADATTATTFSDVPGLSFAVEANKTYDFRFVVFFQTAATTTALRLAVNGPAATSCIVGGIIATAAQGNATTHANGVQFAFDTSIVASTGGPGGSSVMAIVEGTISTGANAGTLALRFASEVSGSSVTILQGSKGEMGEA